MTVQDLRDAIADVKTARRLYRLRLDRLRMLVREHDLSTSRGQELTRIDADDVLETHRHRAADGFSARQQP